MEKGVVTYGDFIEFYSYFSMEKDDVICFLNFHDFLMEKDDMTWDDVVYLHVVRIEINNM
jgi:hypothetical protein